MFFGAVENLERALAGTHTDPRIMIIRLRWVPFIDITGLQTLEEAITELHARNVRVMLTGANKRVTKKLMKAGIIDLISPENFFQDFADAVRVCQTIIEEEPEIESPKSTDLSTAALSLLKTTQDYFKHAVERRSDRDE